MTHRFVLGKSDVSRNTSVDEQGSDFATLPPAVDRARTFPFRARLSTEIMNNEIVCGTDSGTLDGGHATKSKFMCLFSIASRNRTKKSNTSDGVNEKTVTARAC